jgi:hypothetical protein
MENEKFKKGNFQATEGHEAINRVKDEPIAERKRGSKKPGRICSFVRSWGGWFTDKERF